MQRFLPYAKAIVAFLAPGLLILGNAAANGDPITTALLLKALGAAVVAGGAVYATPNKDPNGAHQNESVQPDDGYQPRHLAG